MYKDPEMQKQYQKENYQQKKQNIEWYERRKKINREWKAKHKEEQKEYKIKYVKDRPWATIYKCISGRCNNPNHPSYDMYGAKGIKNFLTMKDVKYLWFRDEAYKLERPSIDRKDPKDNYDINNCRFIELIENISKTWFNSETGKITGRLGGLAKKEKYNGRTEQLVSSPTSKVGV